MNNIQKTILCYIILFFLSFASNAQNDTLNRTDKYGKKYGYWKQYKNGILLWEGQFYNDKPIGEIYHYFPNGKVSSYSKYYPNSPKVNAIIYHKNGQKASEGEYINKEKNGKWMYYNANGILICEENWKNGLKNGICKIFSSQDGILLEEKEWLMGKLHGIYKTYYPSGQARICMNYNKGQMDGDFTCYYPNGKIWRKGQYSKDFRIGQWTLYNEDGNEIKIENIENGSPTQTILGFQTAGQWLKIDSRQIAYFYHNVDDIVMQLNNKKTIRILNTNLNDIAVTAGVELFIFINKNVLSSYNAIRKVEYTHNDGIEEAIITLYPHPDFEVFASGEELQSLKSLLNTNEPSPNDN